MSQRSNQNREAVDPKLDCVVPGRFIWSILSRLPVKSLVRFKMVCRPWMDLIKNPAFINLHYNRFSQLPKTLSSKSDKLSCTILGLHRTTDFDPGEPDKLFLSSCKGLICIGRPLVSTRILLWNPATRLWKVLPPPTGRDYGWSDVGMVSLGFSCNEEGDDYKVVRIKCMKRELNVYVEMYSSKSDSSVGRELHPRIRMMASYEESLAYVRGMREIDLALDEFEFQESNLELVADGFFTCLGYADKKDVDIYYGLAS